MQQSSDYPRKYSHHNNSPGGNFDSSPPPHKRNKKDWDMDQVYGGSGGGYHSSRGGHQQQSEFQKTQLEPEYPTQPPFFSFKQFLQQQDDSISDEEAIKRYNEYKVDFKKTQINNFFLEHKEEEWFKSRYHPDENHKRRREQNQFVLNRCEAFMELMNAGWLEDVGCEYEKQKELIRFLDAFVIKLEGGSDDDIKKLLDGVETKDDQLVKDESNSKNEAENGGVESKQNGDSKKRKKSTADDGGEDSGSEESGAYTDDSDNEAKKSSNRKESSASQSTTNNVRQLHRTSSIFMRNLAPSVTKQDLENLCKSYEGFKRVALSDPAPERGFFRRGWITFDSNIDVKKICWSLQNIKLKECNPGAIVNRELTSRIRPITNLVSHHKTVVKNNIKLAMKIVQNMDKKWNLWQDSSSTSSEDLINNEETNQDKNNQVEDENNKKSEENNTATTAATAESDAAKLEEEAFGKLKPNSPLYLSHKFNGQNPLLENITDYLVDEINAEEEELLGDNMNENATNKSSSSSKPNSFDIEIDKSYNKVLDRLVLYLRMVHSIDYYNSIEYQQEDLMPNRCGIMFVRPALPVNAASASLKINNDDINTYIQQFESKMKPYSEYKEKIEAELARKLGIKDIKEEIEKFIKVNTQELAPDRWLCPLSGKRFKGPEFIRKHLFYKHMEKIIEVKKDVVYFNNYVFDPKRPQLPEHPSNKSGSHSGNQSTSSPGGQMSSMPSSMSGQHYPNQNMMMNSPGMMGAGPAGMMPYGQMGNNRMGYQGGFMPDMNMYGGYNPSFGGGNMGGYHPQGGAGFKKPGFGPNMSGGYQRRG